MAAQGPSTRPQALPSSHSRPDVVWRGRAQGRRGLRSSAAFALIPFVSIGIYGMASRGGWSWLWAAPCLGWFCGWIIEAFSDGVVAIGAGPTSLIIETVGGSLEIPWTEITGIEVTNYVSFATIRVHATTNAGPCTYTVMEHTTFPDDDAFISSAAARVVSLGAGESIASLAVFEKRWLVAWCGALGALGVMLSLVFGRAILLGLTLLMIASACHWILRRRSFGKPTHFHFDGDKWRSNGESAERQGVPGNLALWTASLDAARGSSLVKRPYRA